MIASADTGGKSFNFVLRASYSVCPSFNFVFDLIRSVMGSADDNSEQLPADQIFLHCPVVLSSADLFDAYLSAKVRAA